MDSFSDDDEPLINVNRKIIFREPLNEVVYRVPTEEDLSEVCLNVLTARYNNPRWGYKPAYDHELDPEAVEFLEYYETEKQYLPALLRRHADRIYRQLNIPADEEVEEAWDWYKSATKLTSLPHDRAVMYRVAHKGKLVPTSFYLLEQRRYHPGEGFIIVT